MSNSDSESESFSSEFFVVVVDSGEENVEGDKENIYLSAFAYLHQSVLLH